MRRGAEPGAARRRAPLRQGVDGARRLRPTAAPQRRRSSRSAAAADAGASAAAAAAAVRSAAADAAAAAGPLAEQLRGRLEAANGQLPGAMRAAEASLTALTAPGGAPPTLHWGSAAGAELAARAAAGARGLAEAAGLADDLEAAEAAARAAAAQLSASLEGAAAAVAAAAADVLPAPPPAAAAAAAEAARALQAAATAAHDAAAAAAAALGGALPALPPLDAVRGAAEAAAGATFAGGAYGVPLVAAAAAAAFGLAFASAPPGKYPAPPTDALPTAYSADALAAYFGRRPVETGARAAAVAAELLGWAAALAADVAAGRAAAAAPARAAQLRAAVERLGPAYVKIAQAVSTRVDVLPPAYLAEAERLQDRVPPFADADARAAVAAACGGRALGAVFSAFSDRPVAAASLGQVYRATLAATGAEVAVKVRRPGVQRQVALDLYLMRRAAAALAGAPGVRSDWAAIVDEWGARFLEEMDYEREAANAARFAADVEARGLRGVVVPRVAFASPGVLATEWVDGEKLCESAAGDVRELCNTMISVYLVQLLDTGFLHADPHPGNLLRTRDGRLAILDYGLMTEIPEPYMLALLDYIAHLSVGDWESLADDLVALGFVGAGAPSPRESGLAPAIGRVLAQLSAGGGARRVDVGAVSAELEGLTQAYPHFRIPPYFALILRCFSVIEGIALRADPDYAIVKECFPYLARRLLTDDTPRARAALRQLLFGSADAAAGGGAVDAERLARLVQGFSEFTVAGLESGAGSSHGVAGRQAGAPAQQQQQQQPRLLSDTALDALRVVFSPRGTYVQELLVGGAAAAADAAAAAGARALLGSGPAALGAAALEAAGPWRALLAPVAAPLEALARAAPALQPSRDGDAALATVGSLARALAAAPRPGLAAPAASAANAARLAAELVPLLPELLPGAAKTAQMFGAELLRRAGQRAARGARAAGGAEGGAPPEAYVAPDDL